MAPRKGAKRKSGKEIEAAEIEADRIAAFADNQGVDLTHDEAVQGANLASGVPVDEPVADYLAAPLDAEVTAEQDAAVEAATEEGNAEGEEKPNTSVVKDKFKIKYIENAKARGVAGKAAKRSNWDWLAQQIASFCLDEKAKIDISKFAALLDANGVDHSKWTNRNKGWEGRFRMTGRVALQKVVANSGVLAVPESEPIAAPEEWCAIYKTKAAA